MANQLILKNKGKTLILRNPAFGPKYNQRNLAQPKSLNARIASSKGKKTV